eukprot:m.173916 g.173916  ORF g.173916 m.173916 type:complete len:744 (-) comp16535_c1_seq2:397-2628(-)
MSGLKMFEANDVKVYNLTAGREMPKWLSERKRRQLLKQDLDLKRRIELIQDFHFPTASSSIRISPDQEYVVACGTYKPRIRCFELSQMSMKFERHLNCEALQVHILSEDYAKLAMLMADRYVELHSQAGYHYRTRVPAYGRDINYFKPTSDLLIAGDDSIFRLNLSEGRFLEPLVSTGAHINKIAINPVNGLLAGGTAQATIECFDARAATKSIATLDIAKGIPPRLQRHISGIPEVTAVQFLRNGLGMAVGTSTGQVLMYDIRSRTPMVVKDHKYGLPIIHIHEHELTENLLTVDRKIVKFWDKESGDNFCTFETDAEINDCAMFPESGLFFLAGEQSKIMSYFIPSLGPAPRWCSHLDAVTEELDEEDQPVMYDDYKFVTRQELSKLDLTDLIGTGMLRAYMHGFFIDTRLYNEAVAAANPLAQEEYRQQQIKQKLEEGTASRLQLEKLRWKLPKVNRALAKHMLTLKNVEEERELLRKEKERARNGGAADGDVEAECAETKKDEALSVDQLVDERFHAMFDNAEFEVDENVEEYQSWRPSSKRVAAEVKSRLEAFEGLSDEESEPDAVPSDEDEEQEQELLHDLLGVQDDSEDEAVGSSAKRRQQQRKAQQKRKKTKEAKGRGPSLQLDHDDLDIKPMQTSAMTLARKEAKSTTFARLLEQEPLETDQTVVKRTAAGGKVSQMRIKRPIKGGKRGDDRVRDEPGSREQERERRQSKRGVRALGLAKPSTVAYWRGRQVRR